MSFPQRLPTVDNDDGQWGDILNQYIGLQHYNLPGVDSPLNGGHQVVTIRPGTTAGSTAPLKFMSGSLMTTPEAGAVEFLTNNLYFTQTTSTARKTIAMYDTSGATGDIYYRDSSGFFKRLPVGSSAQVLTTVSGLPAWQSPSGVINNMDGGSASAVYGGAVTVDGGGA
jgi:hypothetical protein